MGASAGSGFSDEDDAVMSDINVTPLVDVVLVLLIVFMITVPAIVASAPIKVDLPESGSVEQASELPPITVSVRRGDDGSMQIFLNERQTDADGLKQLIEELGLVRDDQRVNLAADRAIPYGEVIRVMDLLHELGLKKIAVDTKHVQ
ncbi:MAG: biopolymer transporter ExbD [Planctomycetaceae bacterium]|uniref:Biopolymer transport protein ExbD n=1 Tax=Lacipirellula limnantheis TaxID=2528024 RepID=A0A517U0S8_9BACT|nr:biopolymer transporter ExbD [Lacipirellula limnantheis]MBL9162542.1 biopolymer transporter ExbD [Planctomycetaceae bacterium]QDT74222.1 Biopolymer transport protein ExbD [Lacipirellula limnantheis]